MSRHVLDASALLALLLNEDGAARVAQVVRGAFVSTVNLSEVVAYHARTGAPESAIREILDNLPIEAVAFDSDMANDAGMLIALTARKGLSLGDRACLALARRLDATVLTADRPWSRLPVNVGVAIELIRA